ncbi:hypothetical protein Tcan_02350 [Toxocara canis]|uniref:Uncharacterized protein n=1 Tax=Toxocara canis TaxID=6265 RepID=A0A0B2UJV4_TOXCA|nr:hypothetical protein Tcan_02350 [Toxocara canis]
MDLIENATEINFKETDRGKMMLSDATRINEGGKFEKQELIEFYGSPLTIWEDGKLGMAITMIRQRRGRTRNERKSAQNEAAEEIQRNLDIIIQHWSSAAIGTVLAAIFVVFLLTCFKRKITARSCGKLDTAASSIQRKQKEILKLGQRVRWMERQILKNVTRKTRWAEGLRLMHKEKRPSILH